jgi:serine protease Do
MKNLALLVAFALAACGPSETPLAQQAKAPQTKAAPPAEAPSTRAAALPDFTSLIQKQGPAVVNVITRAGKPPPLAGGRQSPDDPLAEFFRRFGPDQQPRGGPRQGLASGFIISADGYILTNAHVVADASEVTVRLADKKREFKAKVVGADERTDVALIKVDASGLPTVTLGDSSKLQPGQWVAAIGSPFGFANTITAGIVSATERSLPTEAYVPFIQTDVAVNPGNSGGPLLNLAGEVVGINSIIISGTGGYMGVSFAIPIELALDISKQLQAKGKVTRGRIGVVVQPVTRELAQAFGLKEPQGALIAAVEPGGPADKAGVKAGDVVLAYNGKPLEDENMLPRLVAATKPGETANLEVWRSGKRTQIKVTAAELPSETRTAQAAPEKAEKTARLGVVVSELPPAQRQALGVDFGLVVQDVQKPDVALRPGDVILAVNRQKFGSLEEFNKLIANQKGDTVALLVRRGANTVFVPVEVG